MRDFKIIFYLKEDVENNITCESSENHFCFSDKSDPVFNSTNLKNLGLIGRDKSILKLSTGKKIEVEYDELTGKYSYVVNCEYSQLGKINPHLIEYIENFSVMLSIRTKAGTELPEGFVEDEFYNLTTSRNELPGLIGTLIGMALSGNTQKVNNREENLLYTVELFVKNIEWYQKNGEAFIKKYLLYRK
jgi:hypothetical protein